MLEIVTRGCFENRANSLPNKSKRIVLTISEQVQNNVQKVKKPNVFVSKIVISRVPILAKVLIYC